MSVFINVSGERFRIQLTPPFTQFALFQDLSKGIQLTLDLRPDSNADSVGVSFIEFDTINTATEVDIPTNWGPSQ